MWFSHAGGFLPGVDRMKIDCETEVGPTQRRLSMAAVDGQHAVVAQPFAETTPLEPLHREENELGEDDYSGEEYSYESETDDEIDWDPDRERLMRFVRQSQSNPGPRAAGLARKPVGLTSGHEQQKSLAERRNEWRAARGLERQKTVQELIAEKRAQRLGLTASSTEVGSALTTTAASGQSGQPTSGVPTASQAPPYSDSRIDVAERHHCEAVDAEDEATAAVADVGLGSSAGSSRRTKNRGWPWRTR